MLKILKAFEKSDSGHVAVITSLTAVPILMLTSVAIDNSNVNSERIRVSAALDSAALAAVTNQNLTEGERREFAEKVFWDNVHGDAEKIKLTVVEAQDTRVLLQAETFVGRSFPIFGNNKVAFSEEAAAELTYGETICMLALAPDEEEAFLVTGGAKLTAPNCTVQVNSTDSNAAVAFAGGSAEAQSFCVAGGTPNSPDDWSGSAFVPFVNTECSVIADPYADKVYTGTDSCVTSVRLADSPSLKDEPGRFDLSGLFNGAYSQDPTVGVETVSLDTALNSSVALDANKGIELSPGTYCGGLDLTNLNVTFKPGTYVIKDGPLVIAAGSNIDATAGVTFVMQGDEAVFQAKSGGTAKFKAPAEGEFAGLAFFQDVQYDMKNFKTLPTGISSLDAGSNVHINGTVYLPDQKLNFKGGSVLSNEASSTSFIAYQLRLGEGSTVEVDVNSSAVGLPPIEPRSDDGARLSQ